MRIFSGIRASGAKTLGNYSGGFRQYARTQEEGEAFFCIVDLHAITVEHDPEELHRLTLHIAARSSVRVRSWFGSYSTVIACRSTMQKNASPCSCVSAY